MGDSVERARKEGISFMDSATETEDKEEEYEVEKFITADGKLSFRYSSEWSDLENEDILGVLGHPSGDYEGMISEDQLSELREAGVEIDEAYEDYLDTSPEEFAQQQEREQDLKEEFESVELVFTKIKTPFPDLSMGIISLQELILEEEKKDEEVLDLIKSELTDSTDESEKIEIIETEERENFKIIETETLLGGRPVFKSDHLIFIKSDGLYILTLGSLYEDREEFVKEFEKIIASVSFDENR